jgi:hypothetical protein
MLWSSMAAATGYCIAAFISLALYAARDATVGILAPEDWTTADAMDRALRDLGLPAHEVDVSEIVRHEPESRRNGAGAA